MGGSLGFTIREKNGKEHRMCRWTNQTPYFINCPQFINQNPEHLKEYLGVWYDMVKSYESGDYKKEDFTMVDVYAPNPFLAPIDYGLVVVDYKTLNILHMQSYTNYGRILASQVDSAIKGYEEDSEKDLEEIKQLHNEKRFKRVECYDGREEVEDHFPIIDISNFTIEQIFENCNYSNRKKDNCSWSEIYIDMSPWKITRFQENLDGCKKFKKAILDLGFILTDKEEELWVETESYHEEKEKSKK